MISDSPLELYSPSHLVRARSRALAHRPAESSPDGRAQSAGMGLLEDENAVPFQALPTIMGRFIFTLTHIVGMSIRQSREN